jgi:hypothetical protein
MSALFLSGRHLSFVPLKRLMREVMARLRRFLSGLSIVVAGLLAVTAVWTVLTIPARAPEQRQATMKARVAIMPGP